MFEQSGPFSAVFSVFEADFLHHPKKLPQQGTLIALSENSQVLLPKVFPHFLFFRINFRVILRSGPLMWHSLCRHFVLHLITHFVLHLMTEGGVLPRAPKFSSLRSGWSLGPPGASLGPPGASWGLPPGAS